MSQKMQKKAVMNLDMQDGKEKKKAMKVVSGFEGIDSIAMSLKDRKLTVTGDFDPIDLVEKLRRFFPTQIETLGPVKDEKKGEDKNNTAAVVGGKDQKPISFPLTYYPPYPPYQNYPSRPTPPSCYYDPPCSVEEDPMGASSADRFDMRARKMDPQYYDVGKMLFLLHYVV